MFLSPIYLGTFSCVCCAFYVCWNLQRCKNIFGDFDFRTEFGHYIKIWKIYLNWSTVKFSMFWIFFKKKIKLLIWFFEKTIKNSTLVNTKLNFVSTRLLKKINNFFFCYNIHHKNKSHRRPDIKYGASNAILKPFTKEHILSN
jgi:hypothetical protein